MAVAKQLFFSTAVTPTKCCVVELFPVLNSLVNPGCRCPKQSSAVCCDEIPEDRVGPLLFLPVGALMGSPEGHHLLAEHVHRAVWLAGKSG